MTVWIVIKDLYGTDNSGFTDHTSEIMGVFANERKAEDFRDDMLNKSEYEIVSHVPYGEELNPFTIYIDGVVEGMEVIE